MWIMMLVPLLFYILYNRYDKAQKLKEEKKMKELYKKLKDEKESFEAGVPNRKPQMPGKSEMQPDYVGLDNNQQRVMEKQQYNEMKNTVDTRLNGGGVSYNPDDIRGSMNEMSNVVDAFPPMMEQSMISGFDPYGQAFAPLM